MSHATKHIHCDNCGTLTETKLNDIELFCYGTTWKFSQVVTEMCPACGEIYLPSATLDKCEKKIERELVAA